MMELLEAEELAERWCKIEANPEDGQQMLDVIETLLDACGKYRSLYEGAEKRIQRYRDVAGRPDIPSFNLNKDVYSNFMDMRRAYHDYKEHCFITRGRVYPFEEWLFFRHDDGKEHSHGQIQRN